MYEISIKLKCPSCGLILSKGKIYREKAIDSLREINRWEDIKTILQCPKCTAYLIYSGEYALCQESETKTLDEIKTLFKKRKGSKVLIKKLF